MTDQSYFRVLVGKKYNRNPGERNIQGTITEIIDIKNNAGLCVRLDKNDWLLYFSLMDALALVNELAGKRE